MRVAAAVLLGLVSVLCAWMGAVEPIGKPDKPIGPLSPKEALASFRLVPGFRIELVAAEPDVIDPVAMAFDEDGRLFVVEMPGYPNGGVGTGKPVIAGRVRLLEDRDGDGYFETSRIFVDDLRFPTGICVYRGGLIIANAPDLVYCRDTDGDGRADQRSVLYTGFGLRNIQQLANSLQFHFDNWIYGCNAAADSEIRAVQDLHGKAVSNPANIPLHARHFRFRPEKPGQFEPASGGGQYGLTADDYGQWFTCTNSQHIRHIVLPERYLIRNPYLRVQTVTIDIPDGTEEHTAAAKLFRISPFEPWRLERTQMRREGPEAKRFAKTELVPGGYVTSACGILIERGGRFPPPHAGCAYVCDPANNVIHRDVLVPAGPTFTARRLDRDCEFLASVDTWFRPVFLCQGPDGAIYVADFYREVIETPLSLPEEIKRRYNLESRGRGRIWRIVPQDGRRLPPPCLSRASSAELVALLEHENAWHRLTAQRLLLERKPGPEIRPALVQLARRSARDVGRIHALWTLEGLGLLEAEDILTGLRDDSPRVREQALVLAEPFLQRQDAAISRQVLSMVSDGSDRVRFQLAFALGYIRDPGAAEALTQLLRREGANRWMQMAILSSALPHAFRLLELLAEDEKIPADILVTLVSMVAGNSQPQAVERVFLRLMKNPQQPTAQQLQLLSSLAQGFARQGKSLEGFFPADSRAGQQLNAWFRTAAEVALDSARPVGMRIAAVRVLGYREPTEAMAVLRQLLAPQQPPELQLAAVQSLAQVNSPQVVDVLLEHWASFSPTIRRAAQEAFFARSERLPRLLQAVETGTIRPQDLDLVYRQQLLQHPDPAIRNPAQKLLAQSGQEDRQKVVAQYRVALQLTGQAERGRELFAKHCAICHRLGQVGTEVGPDLLSALKTKTPEGLLLDILDPSREVDSRYLNYLVADRSGRVYSGIIAAETATAITLRRAEGMQDTLLRSEIEQIQSTGKSLMPDGFEKQLTPQDLADLIAWLQQMAR
jgi:putative membrane-bound dehydrogenase-like protein